MGTSLYAVKNLIRKEDITLNELYSYFHVTNFQNLSENIIDFIEENLEELVKGNFLSEYRSFLLNLISITKTPDDKECLRFLIMKSIKILSERIKTYNKGELHKDGIYHLISATTNGLKQDIKTVEHSISLYNESEIYKIAWFLMTDLKNIEYVYKFIMDNPSYVNLRNIYDNHIFIEILEYFISNLDNIDDKTYFKRLFVMLLESDELLLSNDELSHIYEILALNVSPDTNFIKLEIDRHYPIINSYERKTTIDYCNKECPVEISKPLMDDRTDLRHLFTLSVDSITSNDEGIYLFDDAFSVEKIKDNYVLYVHIADVSEFVSIGSETDIFMRNLSEKVYIPGYRTEFIPKDIIVKSSILEGRDIPALTVRIVLNENAEILDFDYLKSIVKKDYSLAINRQLNSEIKDNMLLEKAKSDLRVLFDLSMILRKRRGETCSNIKLKPLIMEELNILVDLVTASYFKERGIVFPYKNYLGKNSVHNTDASITDFILREAISVHGRELLNSSFDPYNRVFYDIVDYGNRMFKGRPCGNIGNPLREYISLESDRLIKDLIIDKLGNTDFWEERILMDCIDYTESNCKIKELYGKR